MDAAALAAAWETAKTDIRVEALRIFKKGGAQPERCTRRLLRQERRILEAAAGVAHRVEAITDLLDVMSFQDVAGDTPLS
jgi:hypothetical protein